MKKIIYFFILLFLLTSCAINYRPIPSKNIKISQDYAILKTKNYTLIIQYKYWIKTPQNLSDYFTTFYLTLINKSDKPINVEPNDIYLIDQNGKQYDIVPIEDIYNLMFSKDTNLQLLFDEKNQQEYQNLLQERQDAKRNIMNYSFSFGKLMVGAKKTGYIFFNKLPSDNKECKVIFKGHTIKFIRTK